MFDYMDKKRIPILMYHSVSEQAAPKYRPFAVSPVLFTQHLEYLGQQAYIPITVTQLIHARDGKAALPEKPVLLTFDDGMQDFYTEALPILQKYRFPATLYVVAGYMNSTSRWLQHEGEANRLMLTWEQLIEIDASGIECGGHTLSHPQLDMIPLSRAREEIVRCKQILEEHLGHEIHSLAYPYGYFNSAIKQEVQAAGYTSACTVKHEMCSEMTDRFALTRLMVEPTTRVHLLEALLTRGHTSVLQKTYRRVRTPIWRVIRQARAWGNGSTR